jgi:hypothetical protein
LIICPSCGSTVNADLCMGCPACGARAVGPPLAKAQHELPSFGRASLVFAAGFAVLCTFLGMLIAVLVENKSWPRFWTLVSAGEVAAWRVKWPAIPILLALLIVSAKVTRSIKQDPARYIGLKAARFGLLSALTVAVLIATLIGLTIPVRLERRQWGIEAATYARGYTLNRALLAYRDLHGTYPTDPDKFVDALRTLPDPDGSIAEALRFVDPNGYAATTTIAAASTKAKPLVARGVALRNASPTANPEPPGVSFTSFTLSLPSEHRLFGSDDDYVLKDGVIQKASEVASTSSNTPRSRNP